ncbi:MAG: ferredoxin family protein [Myxococcales bacterium]|nr:ferredoxin family protein [Myxococcales bacterium]
MPFIIAEPCINVKDTACVAVCPVDCIHPTVDDEGHAEHEMLYIDPDECIDCGACESECPVSAIFPDDSLTSEWEGYTEVNAVYFKDGKEAAEKKRQELFPNAGKAA